MDPAAMTPHGLALQAFFDGEHSAQLVVRRDDGFESPLPVSYFFRQPAEFSPLETAALARCRGHVLDIGAGSGLHSLVLESEGLNVTAIDISSHAVEIMCRRRVRDVRRADVFDFQGGSFDTLLMLGHGIGCVEDLEGLRRFLAHAHGLLRTGGHLLFDSLDVRRTGDPAHLAYQDALRQKGRYFGETRVQFEFHGRAGPFCGWLHVDPETLRQEAEPAGWRCEIPHQLMSGDYLADLVAQEVDAKISQPSSSRQTPFSGFAVLGLLR